MLFVMSQLSSSLLQIPYTLIEELEQESKTLYTLYSTSTTSSTLDSSTAYSLQY